MVRIWKKKNYVFFTAIFFSRIFLRIIWIRKFCLQKVLTFRKSTWCELFSFLLLIVLDLENFIVLGRLVFCLLTLYISIMHLCRTNNLSTMFVAKFELMTGKFARKSLLSGKLSTWPIFFFMQYCFPCSYVMTKQYLERYAQSIFCIIDTFLMKAFVSYIFYIGFRLLSY